MSNVVCANEQDRDRRRALFTAPAGLSWNAVIGDARMLKPAKGPVIELGNGLYVYQFDPSEIAEVGTVAVLAEEIGAAEGVRPHRVSMMVDVVESRTEPPIYFDLTPDPYDGRARDQYLTRLALDYGIQRLPGESDDTLRERVLAFLHRGPT